AVKQVLATKLEQARDEVVALVLAEKLGQLLEKHVDMFRLQVRHDPPSLSIHCECDCVPTRRR
ncbi:hypothetical protein H310_10004, partial [Aphanomyces invadans]